MVRFLAARYSARAHAILLGWNSIAAFYVGSSEFRNEVAGLQHSLHVPTWVLALFTGLANITATYRNWQKQR
jgi:hypothetical protein